MLCSVCHQPECDQSHGEVRVSTSGSQPTLLDPGIREYRGYGDWAVHPDEARLVLHRGYAIVDGKQSNVFFIHNEKHATQIHVEGT